MSIPSWREYHMPASCGRSGSTSVARHRVRRAILGLWHTVVLPVIVMSLVFLTCEPTARDEKSPAWSIATGHPQGVQAVARAGRLCRHREDLGPQPDCEKGARNAGSGPLAWNDT